MMRSLGKKAIKLSTSMDRMQGQIAGHKDRQDAAWQMISDMSTRLS